MKTLFEILPLNAEALNATLILEVGDTLISASIKDTDSNSFTSLAVYQPENTDKEVYADVMKQLLEEKGIFKYPVKNVRIISTFSQSVFIPFSLSEKEHYSTMVDMVHGDLNSSSAVHSDLINEDGVYNVFKMPGQLSAILSEKYDNYHISHLYTHLVKCISREHDKMFLLFYPGKVIAVIVKGGKIMLVNSFIYQSPEDVSYLVLNLSKQFGMKNVPLELSGLIEEDSVLFKEVHKYFSMITFSDLPADYSYPDELKNFPSHYFSHHFGISVCE